MRRDFRRDLEDFRALLKAWAFVNPDVPDEATLALDEFGDIDELCTFFADHFLESQRERDSYETLKTPTDKAEYLLRYVQTDLVKLTRKVSAEARTQPLH